MKRSERYAKSKSWSLFRLLCVSMAFLMMVLLMFSCNGQKNPLLTNESTDDSETSTFHSDTMEEEVFPNLGGKTFVINTCTSVLNGNVLSNEFIEGSDDKNAHFVSQLAFGRNEFVCEKLNVEIEYVQNSLRYDKIPAYYQQLFLSDEPLDLIINKLYPLASMSITGSFTNIANNNYFDFYSDYWYTEWMNSLSLNGGNTCYLLAGDYFIDVIRYSGLLIYNDQLFDTLFSDEGGSSKLRQSIYQGEWTMEKLLYYSNTAYLDIGDDGKTADDRYGWVASQIWYNGIPYFIGASDLQFLSEDQTKLDMNHERSLKLFDSLKMLFYGDGCIPFRRTEGVTLEVNFDASPESIFRAGRGLFCGQSQFATMERLSDYDSWSVLPYPKLDLEQDYITPSAELTEVGAIPRTCAQKDDLLILLEYLNRATSDTVMENYYQSCLQYRYSKTPETRDMVIFIHDHIRGAFEQAYNNYLSEALMWNTFYIPIIDGQEFVSSYKKIESSANTKLGMMHQNWERYLEN